MSGLASTYLTETVTITPQGTLDASGTRNFDGTAVSTLARLSNSTGMLRTLAGREITYDRVFYVDASETVSTGDRVTYGGVNHEVLEVYVVRDLAGTQDHKKLYCGRR